MLNGYGGCRHYGKEMIIFLLQLRSTSACRKPVGLKSEKDTAAGFIFKPLSDFAFADDPLRGSVSTGRGPGVFFDPELGVNLEGPEREAGAQV